MIFFRKILPAILLSLFLFSFPSHAQENPDSPEQPDAFLSALAAADNGNYSEAASFLSELLSGESMQEDDKKQKVRLLYAVYCIRANDYQQAVQTLKKTYYTTDNPSIQAAVSLIMYYLKIHLSTAFRLFKSFPMGRFLSYGILKGIDNEKKFRIYLFNYPSLIILFIRLLLLIFVTILFHIAAKKIQADRGSPSIFSIRFTEVTIYYAVCACIGFMLFSWIKATDFYINDIITGLVFEAFFDAIVLLLAAAIIFYIKSYGFYRTFIGPNSWKDILKDTGLYLGGVIIAAILIRFFIEYEIFDPVYGVSPRAFVRIRLGGLPSFLFWVIIFIVSPIAEEVFFRGFYYSAIRATFGKYTSAALVSFLFSLLHFEMGAFVPLFVLSMVLCYLVEEKKALLPAIILHSFYNVLAYSGFALSL